MPLSKLMPWNWGKAAPVEQKNSEVYASIGRSNSAGTRNTAGRYWQYSSEGYQINPVVRQCVDMKGAAMSQIPWVLVDESGERVEDHPILDILANPNPNQTRIQFWEQVVLHMDCGGGAPLHAQGSGPGQMWVEEGQASTMTGAVQELYTYRPDQLAIDSGPTGVPSRYIWQGNGQQVVFPVDPMDGNSRIRLVNYANALGGDPYRYGTAPLQTVAYAVDWYNGVMKWNGNLLANRAVPEGYWESTADGSISPEQVDKVNKLIYDQYAGSKNGGKTPFVGHMRFNSTSMSPGEMAFESMLHNASREIARGLGCPPLLLGIPGDNTYANYELALEAFWTQTMLPMAERFTQTLNAWFVPMWDPSLKLIVDIDAIPALEGMRSRRRQSYKDLGYVTTNEKRKANGLPPLEGQEHNEIMTPANVLPANMSADQAKAMADGFVDLGYGEKAAAAFVRELASVDQVEVKACDDVCEHHDTPPVESKGQLAYNPDTGEVVEITPDGVRGVNW